MREHRERVTAASNKGLKDRGSNIPNFCDAREASRTAGGRHVRPATARWDIHSNQRSSGCMAMKWDRADGRTMPFPASFYTHTTVSQP